MQKPPQLYKNTRNQESYFSFSTVEKVNVIEDIKVLSKNKTFHDSIFVKILKEKVIFFSRMHLHFLQ